MQSNDPDLLRALYTSAESKFSRTRDLILVAESILERFKDPEWARRVYAKAQQAGDLDTSRYELAASLENKLQDRKWAVLVRKSLANAL